MVGAVVGAVAVMGMRRRAQSVRLVAYRAWKVSEVAKGRVLFCTL